MTIHWTDGYQTEVNYTFGYYRDLSPNYQRFCLLIHGVDCPTANVQQHCELGFGQGVSLNVHAASHNGIFYGTDFNPAHASHANMLAMQSQAESHFYDASFDELLNHELPMFDSISLHGIWSWISHENQHIILKFIRKFLKPNGIVYISYNCLTGWAANMPIRELFHSHFKFNSTSTNPLQKVKDSLNFSESLIQQKPIFAQRHPNALQKVQELKKQNPNYLIHEYLNQDWQCFSFQQVVRILEDIKLTYAGSTDLSTQLQAINFSTEHQQFLNSIEHPIFKEQCYDYFANTQFRRDLFIRGKNTLTPLQVKQRLRDMAFVLLLAPEQLPTTIQGFLGEFNLLQEIYAPIGQYFKTHDYVPQTIADLEHALPQLNHNQIVNAMVILTHLNLVQPCQEQVTEQQLKQVHQFNHYILQQASYHNNYQTLACALTGIGLMTDHLHLLFYRAHFVDGLSSTADLANYVHDVLQQLTWHLLDEQGENITDPTIIKENLIGRAEKFIASDRLKIAKKLKLFA